MRHPCTLPCILLALTSQALTFSPVQAAEMPAAVRQAVDQAHHELWRRFVNGHGHLYDYTALDGSVQVPTPDECEAGKPNALAWWTPIENGAFFGGLYLDAVVNRALATQDPATAERAHRIAEGLVRLAEVGHVSGFVARGFATDGQSHYAASSSDQTFPWFYGLVRYADSSLPSSAQRKHVVESLARVARGLEKDGWKMPTDRDNFGHFGHWAGGFAGSRGTLTGAEPQFDAAVRLLCVLRGLHRVTGDAHWFDLFRARLAEKPHGSSKSRLEICAGGVQYVAPGEPPRYPESPPIWTSASSQAGLRALVDWEDDAAVKQQLQRGLDTNAASAARFVGRFRQYDNDNTIGFDPDWRKLNAFWKPQSEIGEAVTLATQQYRAWNRQSPRRLLEADLMRDPLFAAWIVALSGNNKTIGQARTDIEGVLTHYQWSKLHTSLFFMAECVYWQLEKSAAR